MRLDVAGASDSEGHDGPSLDVLDTYDASSIFSRCHEVNHRTFDYGLQSNSQSCCILDSPWSKTNCSRL